MSDAVGQLEGGKVKALAVTTAKRSPVAPDLPTLAEQGVGDYHIESWNGLFAPTGTPQPVIAKLAEIAAKMSADEALRKRMADIGSIAVANSPDEFSRLLRDETAQWANLVKEIASDSR